jgi:enoyl-[acyl-carrier protein] reductase II
MGSRFIASKDAEFHENYKNVVPPSQAQDTVLVTGVLGPIRLWKNEYSLHHGLVGSKEELMSEEERIKNMSREEYIKELLKTSDAYLAAYRGDTNSGAVLLGQSIGIIDTIESVSDIINQIVSDAEKSIQKAANYIKK